MKYQMNLVFLTVFLAAVATAQWFPEPDKQVQMGSLQFAKRLYQALAKKPGNVFFSPLSAHAVLSMAYQGAGGTTKQAFEDVLGVPDPLTAAEGYEAINSYLNNVENVTLLTANKAFLKNSYSFQPYYEQVIREKFHSEVDEVDFENTFQAAQIINSWVKEKTRNKIEKLFDPYDFDDSTMLVLVNAIYFKGDWTTPFHESDTQDEKFYVDDETRVNVQMMHARERWFKYKESEELDAQVLELPYSSEGVSMILMLPREKGGIAQLEERVFSSGNLMEAVGGLTWETNVALSLPKFKIEKEIPLEEGLRQIGLGEIFDPFKCDLSKMIEGEELYVSKVIQKAFIEINEKGAEAAAASMIILQES